MSGVSPVTVALQKAGNTHVTETHLTTDHAYSGQRIALTTAILTGWRIYSRLLLCDPSPSRPQSWVDWTRGSRTLKG